MKFKIIAAIVVVIVVLISIVIGTAMRNGNASSEGVQTEEVQ